MRKKTERQKENSGIQRSGNGRQKRYKDGKKREERKEDIKVGKRHREEK